VNDNPRMALSAVDEGVPVEFLGYAVGNYDFSAAAANFYRAIEAGRFELPYCDDCGISLHPRREVCPACLADHVSTRAVDGMGALYSFSTMVITPFVEAQADLPYTVGIVQLDAGVAVFGRIDVAEELVAIDMRLEVDLRASRNGLHFVASRRAA
jgi:uncharacterized OB-fold protein